MKNKYIIYKVQDYNATHLVVCKDGNFTHIWKKTLALPHHFTKWGGLSPQSYKLSPPLFIEVPVQVRRVTYVF